MILEGRDADIFAAETRFPVKRKKGISGITKTVYWDEASEEIKNNPKTLWFQETPTLLHGSRKYTFVPLNKQEKEEMRAAERDALIKRFAYILNNFGYDTLEYYVNLRKDNFKRCGLEPDLSAIPRCMENGQCTLACGFFNKKCTYKGEIPTCKQFTNIYLNELLANKK